MNDQALIKRTAAEMKRRMSGETSGHDWWHAYRVWHTAKHIANSEPSANLAIVELGALLHDIADYKLNGGDTEAGPKAAREWLAKNQVDEAVIIRIESILRTIDFKGAKVDHTLPSIEAKIVFDSDKLDAIGAIGIARTFAYGSTKGREMYNPAVKPIMYDSFEAYKNNNSPTINHFYEKLLLLKDMMQTNEGRKLAEQRHKFMEAYLREFLSEWEGEQ